MEPQDIDLSKPVVFNAKKKKKRKYSRGLKGVQVAGRRAGKISSRLVRAVSKGMNAYRKASDKSARKKRDGAMRDFGLNTAKGLSRTLRSSSELPLDMAKVLDTGGSRRMVRRQIRAASRFSRVLRLR
jgi:hypothetical protein